MTRAAPPKESYRSSTISSNRVEISECGIPLLGKRPRTTSDAGSHCLQYRVEAAVYRIMERGNQCRSHGISAPMRNEVGHRANTCVVTRDIGPWKLAKQSNSLV